MKKFDVITIGAATRDVFLRSKAIKVVKDDAFVTGEGECFALGSKIDVDEIVFETGGGATNAAVSFARQGLKTAFAGKIGATDARGQEILDALKAEKINTSLVIKDKDKMTAYSVLLLTARGERTALVYRGASADFRVQDFHWRKMKSKWIYVSSLGGEMSVLRSIWKHAKEHQIKIAWDPGAGELAYGWKKLAPLLKSVDVLHVNQEEAAKLMGMDYEQDEHCFDTLRKMVGGLTIVTGGTVGAFAGTATESWQSGTNHIKVISTTGAGDAFTSGFMAAYIRTGDVPYSLQFGTANAESVIRHISAKEGLLRTHTLSQPVVVTQR